MKYIARGLAFGWFMYLLGTSLADVGELQGNEPYTMTYWLAIKLALFLGLNIMIGFNAGRESGKQSQDY